MQREVEKFQSTHPARGATLLGLAVHAVQGISIHAPREGCDADWSAAYFVPAISIHAPREGCDNLSHQLRLLQVISIHAPREGCDFAAASLPLPSINFNPRTPRGVRLSVPHALECRLRFQSTHPARGATIPLYSDIRDDLIISIHAPREGCDILGSRFSSSPSNFNPRTPRGVRHGQRSRHQRFFRISIHAPREGCDQVCKA